MSPETWVYEAAAEALAKIDDRRTVAPLIDTLQVSTPDTREAILDALGELGVPQGYGPL